MPCPLLRIDPRRLACPRAPDQSPDSPMDQTSKPPKIVETYIQPTATLRDATIGMACEILERCAIEYSSIGDASHLGRGCSVADATIGKFCAIAAEVRIGPPNHPLDRPSQHRFTYV